MVVVKNLFLWISKVVSNTLLFTIGKLILGIKQSQGRRNWWCWWCYSTTNFCQFQLKSISVSPLAPPTFQWFDAKAPPISHTFRHPCSWSYIYRSTPEHAMGPCWIEKYDIFLEFYQGLDWHLPPFWSPEAKLWASKMIFTNEISKFLIKWKRWSTSRSKFLYFPVPNLVSFYLMALVGYLGLCWQHFYQNLFVWPFWLKCPS